MSHQTVLFMVTAISEGTKINCLNGNTIFKEDFFYVFLKTMLHLNFCVKVLNINQSLLLIQIKSSM